MSSLRERRGTMATMLEWKKKSWREKEKEKEEMGVTKEH